LLFGSLVGHTDLFSQNTDSLLAVYKNKSNHDTVRIKALHDATWYLVYSDANLAQKYAFTEIDFAKKTNNDPYLAKAYNTLGACNHMLGNYQQAIQYHEKALALRTQLNDQKGMAASLSNLGAAYEGLGSFPLSLEYYLKGLRIEEKIKNTEGLAQSYNDIGMIYDNMATVSENPGDYKRAIDYFEKSVVYAQKAKNSSVMAAAMGNLANVYDALGDFEHALEYHTKSLDLRKKLNDKHGIAINYGNIGNLVLDADEKTLHKMGIKPNERLKVVVGYYDKCLKIMQEVGDQQGIALSYQNLADVRYKEKKYAETELLLAEAVSIFKEIGDIDNEKNGHEALYRLYKTIGQANKALYEYEYYVFLQDSLYKMDIQNEIVRKDMAYDYAKKAAADSASAAADRVKSTEKIKRQRITQYFLFGGLGLVAVFAMFMFNRFRVTQKQKKVIEEQNKKVIHQKEQLAEKNKEITDSINYAKHLQDAILPSMEEWKQQFPDSFIYYKPKDIIAGDFYFLEKTNGKLVFAAADCTGHGVPGAMVSVVCSNALNAAVKEFKLTDPGKILDKTRELVVQTFSKAGEQNGYTVRDGMDIALCVFDPQKYLLQFAGANNPLWIYEHKTNSIKEIGGHKQPVGYDQLSEPFTTHEIELEKGDMIYVFSDGFADQFGGEFGKKFKYANLKALLLRGSTSPCQDIAASLEVTLKEWRGDIEQVDDVCVIGVRV